MIHITIQCSCGQQFVFDVEPVDGQMPGTVACPACGVDATEASNEYIQLDRARSVPSAAPKKNQTLLIVGVGIAAVFVACVAGGVFLWLKSRSEEAPAPQAVSVAPVLPVVKIVTTTNVAAPSVPSASDTEAMHKVEAAETEKKRQAAEAAKASRVTESNTPNVGRDPNFVAVGALFDRDLKTGHVQYTRVLDQSPAKEAGIMAGDRLLAIDDTLVQELPSKEIADMFYGPVGSKVTMQVISSRTGETNQLVIIRRKYRK